MRISLMAGSGSSAAACHGENSSGRSWVRVLLSIFLPTEFVSKRKAERSVSATPAPRALHVGKKGDDRSALERPAAFSSVLTTRAELAEETLTAAATFVARMASGGGGGLPVGATCRNYGECAPILPDDGWATCAAVAWAASELRCCLVWGSYCSFDWECCLK